MPSSANHDTEQELQLLDSFTGAFARLHHAECHGLSQQLIAIYAHLLDVGPQQLFDTTTYSSDWMVEVKACYRHSRPTKVFDASKILRDTAWMLMKSYGREEESVDCFHFAARLQDAAWEINDQEVALAEEYERRKRAYAEGSYT